MNLQPDPIVTARSLLVLLLVSEVALGQSSSPIPLPPAGPPIYAGAGSISLNPAARVIAADLNLDGYADLAWAAYYPVVALNNGHGRFGASVSFTTSHQLSDLAAGDMNGDGKPDLVVANNVGLEILRGDGLGGFPIRDVFLIGKVTAVWVDDVNLDGKLDVIAGMQGAATQGRIYLGDGFGGLGAGTPFGSNGGYAKSLAVADWNQDGAPDAAIGNWQGSAWIYRGDVLGGMNFATYMSSVGGDTLRFTDVDGDGWLDVAGWYDGATSTLGVSRGNGAGGFLGTQKLQLAGDTVVPLDIDADGIAELLIPGATDGVAVAEFVGGALVLAPSLPYPEIGRAIAAADIDLDGRDDLLFTNKENIAPRVYRAQAGGGLQALLFHPLPTGTVAKDVRLLDLNSDSKLDLLVSDQIGDRLLISAGNGDGTFGAAAAIASGPDPRDLDVADLNLDGLADVVLANVGAAEPNTDTLSSHLGSGPLSFAPLLSSPVGFQPNAVRIGDMNGDGKPDAVVASMSADQVKVLSGDGAGAFSATSAPVSVAIIGAPGIALGDVDLDGDLDCVLSNPSQQVLVLDGDGIGGLLPPYAVVASSSVRPDVFLPDLDHDGFLDLLVGVQGPDSSVGFFRGDGQGQFAQTGSSGDGSSVIRMTVADVDGDGHLDAVASFISYHDLIQVVRGDGAGGAKDWSVSHAGDLGSSGGIACGDLNGDGKVDTVALNDPARVAVALNQHSPSAWVSIGGGSPGSSGTPRLSGIGAPVVGQSIGVHLQNAAPGAPVLWLLGPTQAVAPFAGGVLIPTPQLALGPFLAGPGGDMQLVGTWPAGVSALTLYLQAWIADPTSVGGASATGGLVLRVD